MIDDQNMYSYSKKQNYSISYFRKMQAKIIYICGAALASLSVIVFALQRKKFHRMLCAGQ